MTRWSATWRYGRPDALAWMAVALLMAWVIVAVVGCLPVVAAGSGFVLGVALTVFAFTTRHFLMERDQ